MRSRSPWTGWKVFLLAAGIVLAVGGLLAALVWGAGAERTTEGSLRPGPQTASAAASGEEATGPSTPGNPANVTRRVTAPLTANSGQPPLTTPLLLIAVIVLLIGLAASYQHTQERRMGERTAQLRESQNVQGLLMESLSAGVLIVDATTHVIDRVNPAAASLFGALEDQIEGRVCHSFICPALEGNCPITDRNEKVDESERVMLCANGSKIPILKSVKRVQIGGAEKLLETFLDITDHKRAEQEQERLQAQLMQAQKMESVGRLAGGVAHDFNNMLGVILGHAEMALNHAESVHPRLRGDLEQIQRAAQRSADLTRQLLAFARQQTVEPRVLDLNAAVTGVLKMLQRLIGENITLVWIPAPALWPIRMDPTQIDQILANLAVNARDAIGGVGKIVIETSKATIDAADCVDRPGLNPGEYAMLAVSDNGSGMDKGIQEHIFEPFFTTKEVGKGTGLGLATVYGVVQQNAGFINVYSEPGRGTTFKIYLPRTAAEAQKGTAGQIVRPPRGRGETVLVVEDEEPLLNLASDMLTELGYTVLAAGTPSAAVRLAASHAGEIQLLLTDVVMPEMNGHDLAKRIQAAVPRLKCLFMSGYTANVIGPQGVLGDGVRFIQKPFSLQDLASKVRETLDRG